MLVKRAFQLIQLNPESISRIASMKEKRIIPVNNNEFRYLRFRAIGCMEKNGFNGNYDGFGYREFIDKDEGYGYKSFIGKRAHYNHNSNKGLAGSIGDLPDAYLNRFIMLEDMKGRDWDSLDGAENAIKRQSILDLPNQRDGAIEVLMRIDTTLRKKSGLEPETASALDRVIRMIDTGQKLYCSMGTNIEKSRCPVCFNEARFASDYCSHLKKGKKGGITIVMANQVRDGLDKDLLRPEWLPYIVVSQYDRDEILKGSSNKGVALRNGELNFKLSFFELSIVPQPAFEQADALEKVANKVDGDYLEYLKQQRKILGDNTLIDLYSLLQEDGIISKTCDIGSF